MTIKKLFWEFSTLRDIKDDNIFTPLARNHAGYQLNKIQRGENPDDWKSFDIVGAGTKEIRINIQDGWFRVMYVAKFPEGIYVLHCFKKKTRSTSKKDKEITAVRYKLLVEKRREK